MARFAFVLAGICLLAAPPASAKVTCRLKRSTHVLKVSSTGRAGDRPVLRRAGTRIVVHRRLPGPRIRCPGRPTVTNTDRIRVAIRHSGRATIQLGGGPLAPGATREA